MGRGNAARSQSKKNSKRRTRSRKSGVRSVVARRRSRRCGLRGGVRGDEDVESDVSDSPFPELDPVTPETAETKKKTAEDDKKRKREELNELKQFKKDEKKRTAELKARQSQAKKIAAAQKKDSEKVFRYFEKQNKRIARNARTCPSDTKQTLEPYFQLYKAWGYDTWGGSHSAYEQKTHDPFLDGDGNEFTFELYQVVTDPLMRLLGNIENEVNIVRINNDRLSLTGRFSDRRQFFENHTKTDTYRREILGPYLSSKLFSVLTSLIALGQRHDHDWGNHCLWYAGVCAENILAFQRGQYDLIVDNDERIKEKFGQ